MNAAGVASPLDALRRFAGKKRPDEQCDLCGQEIGSNHPHLLEAGTRKLVCACGPCALLFSARAEARYKRVPEQLRYLPGFRLSDAQWASLMIPINLAFLMESNHSVIALYPSPAGAIESQVPGELWQEIVDANPALREMQPDVEALLVNRLGAARGFPAPEYYVLPVDECYKLVWLVRSQWRGLSGGTEVWEELSRFFAGLQERCGGACLT